MAKLTWDKTGQRVFETGVDHGVLYPYTGENGAPVAGVPWNGLTTVTESPDGAEASPQYADNIKYLNLISAEEFGATIECFAYPPEFAVCNGEAEVAKGVTIGQQPRKKFGFCYRTKIGNDQDGQDHGYKLHIIWGATASPSEKAFATVNDSPEPISFSFDISTEMQDVSGFSPTATMTIDSTKTDKTKLKSLEDLLYGTENQEAKLPTPDEVVALIGNADSGNQSASAQDATRSSAAPESTRSLASARSNN